VKRLAVVAAKPKIRVDSIITTWKGSIITLRGTAGQDMIYDWSPSTYFLDNPDIATPKIQADGDIVYNLTVTNVAGCSARARIKVQVYQKIWIPTAFTPNGDGDNETWELNGIDKYPNAEVYIYDRWGNIVFFSKGYKEPFDAKGLSVDTYMYVIKTDEDIEPFKGAVAVLR
jgi:gliding motility-associated-like protein